MILNEITQTDRYLLLDLGNSRHYTDEVLRELSKKPRHERGYDVLTQAVLDHDTTVCTSDYLKKHFWSGDPACKDSKAIYLKAVRAASRERIYIFETVAQFYEFMNEVLTTVCDRLAKKAA